MPTEPVLPVNEYTGTSFAGFTFTLTNPGNNNGKKWTVKITSQDPSANYTARIMGTWEGSGMGSGPGAGQPKPISNGEIIGGPHSNNQIQITFEYQNNNVGPVTGNPGTSYFSGDLSYTQGYRIGESHFRPRWNLNGGVVTKDGDGNVLDKGPGIVSGAATIT
jgi:hypothetical protein